LARFGEPRLTSRRAKRRRADAPPSDALAIKDQGRDFIFILPIHYRHSCGCSLTRGGSIVSRSSVISSPARPSILLLFHFESAIADYSPIRPIRSNRFARTSHDARRLPFAPSVSIAYLRAAPPLRSIDRDLSRNGNSPPPLASSVSLSPSSSIPFHLTPCAATSLYQSGPRPNLQNSLSLSVVCQRKPFVKLHGLGPKGTHVHWMARARR